MSREARVEREARIERLFKLLDNIKDISEDITPQMMKLILLIGTLDHPNQTELAEKTKYSPSGISKTLRVLGDGLNGAEGLGLVKFEPAVANGREKVAWLTPKGERFIERLLDIL